jgi:hypothetical protein
MKKIKSAAFVAGGLAAAILGLSSPAHATPHTTVGIDHLDWLDDIRPKVNVPNADTNVKHREIVLPLGPG